LEGISDGVLEGVDGSGGGFAQAGFELGIRILDRVEIRRIGWQQQEVGAAGLDQGADGEAFMCRQIVHHDDVAGIEGRRQHLFDIGAESGGIHRPVECHRCSQGGAAQCGGEGRGQPMTVGDRGAAALTTFGAAVKPRHLGRGAGLVDEDQLVGIKLWGELTPSLARRRNVGSILLGRMRAFF
jgi:hypothetical protein